MREPGAPNSPRLFLLLLLFTQVIDAPLAGHPEAMNMSSCRDHFHTSAWKVNSPKFVRCVAVDAERPGSMSS
jgi:hypothetical protein